MKINSKITVLFFLTMIFIVTTGCEKTKSYSELLNDEEKAVNWYLAQKKVDIQIPENSQFEIGENAPFYKMDDDGSVYMQVIRKGNMDDRPEEGDRVYFRFMRASILTMYNGGSTVWEGNADDFSSLSNSTSLIMGNTMFTSTTQYGDGIQVPLDYLGYDSEVNLVVKSTMGFTSDMSSCTPYIYKIKYFKAEY